MKGWIKRLFFLLLTITGAHAQAFSQDGNPLQFISGVSQSSFANPANQNETDKLVVGLPIISGAWMDWKANFSLNYIFFQNFSYSFDRFYRELGEPGYEMGTVTVPFVYLSLKLEDQNFTFSVSNRIFTESTFDHEFLKFIDNGLEPYYGKTEVYGPMNIRAFHYRELAFGWSKQIWEGFQVGVRPKFLFGRFDYDMKEMNISVQTDVANGQLLLVPSGDYRVAGSLDVSYNSELDATSIRPNPDISNYFFNFRNPGAGIDLGINYQINKTTLSAAITDLGFLQFRHTNYDVTYANPLRYNLDELYQSTNPDGEVYKEPKIALQELIDSIPYTIIAQPGASQVVEAIPTNINIKFTYSISQEKEAGLSGQLTYFKGNTRNFISGFFHTALGEKFNLAASVSLFDFKKILPGVGASYTTNRSQFYLSTNNITALIKPSSAKYLNLCFGVNFLFSTH